MNIKEYFEHHVFKTRVKKPLLSEQERLYIRERLARYKVATPLKKVRVRIISRRIRKLDPGSYYYFPYIDALREIGILQNDDARFIDGEPEVIAEVVKKKCEEAVIIELEEVK